MSSPSDSALDFLKRKRLNQMAAAKQKQEAVQQQPVQQQQPAEVRGGFSIGGTIGECDLGASPQMGRGIFVKQHNKMMSPLAMSNMTLFVKKNASQGGQ